MQEKKYGDSLVVKHSLNATNNLHQLELLIDTDLLKIKMTVETESGLVSDFLFSEVDEHSAKRVREDVDTLLTI